MNTVNKKLIQIMTIILVLLVLVSCGKVEKDQYISDSSSQENIKIEDNNNTNNTSEDNNIQNIEYTEPKDPKNDIIIKDYDKLYKLGKIAEGENSKGHYIVIAYETSSIETGLSYLDIKEQDGTLVYDDWENIEYKQYNSRFPSDNEIINGSAQKLDELLYDASHDLTICVIQSEDKNLLYSLAYYTHDITDPSSGYIRIKLKDGIEDFTINPKYTSGSPLIKFGDSYYIFEDAGVYGSNGESGFTNGAKYILHNINNIGQIPEEDPDINLLNYALYKSDITEKYSEQEKYRLPDNVEYDIRIDENSKKDNELILRLGIKTQSKDINLSEIQKESNIGFKIDNDTVIILER